MNAEQWIRHLGLRPHPEGGAYAEVHRSPRMLPAFGNLPGPRCAMTSIHFLLRGGEVSRLHRLRSEELWVHLDGAGLAVHVLEGGAHRVLRVGRGRGESLQAVAPAGAWFGAELAVDDPEAFALVACVVAPGFDFEDFEMIGRREARRRWPAQAQVVERLTPAGS